MTTFIALVVALIFVHVAATTYVRHGRSQAVRDLWDSPYRYNYFRPDAVRANDTSSDDDEVGRQQERRPIREDRTPSSCGA
ncbi:hypothetical protein [Rhodococcoides kyotonense]|nr:hypothetical protein [Rhodococcus kyotonensis]